MRSRVLFKFQAVAANSSKPTTFAFFLKKESFILLEDLDFKRSSKPF